MSRLGYSPCLADPDLWCKEQVRDGQPYYAYILVYVDNIIVVHHDTMSVLKDIDDYMALKPTSVGDPDMCLGAKLSKVKMSNSVWAWAISPFKHV